MYLADKMTLPSSRKLPDTTLSIPAQVRLSCYIHYPFSCFCVNRLFFFVFPIYKVVKNEKLVSVVEDVMVSIVL